MSQGKEVFTAEKRRALAIKAVNRLIAAVQGKRLAENQELAETIAVCIQESGSPRLRALKWLIGEEAEQELEGPDSENPGFLR
jgi:hypothetical protein